MSTLIWKILGKRLVVGRDDEFAADYMKQINWLVKDEKL